MTDKTKKNIAVVSAVGGALMAPIAAALAKTMLTPRKVSNYEPEGDPQREQLYAEKLSRMIRYETVSVRGEIQREKSNLSNNTLQICQSKYCKSVNLHL